MLNSIVFVESSVDIPPVVMALQFTIVAVGGADVFVGVGGMGVFVAAGGDVFVAAGGGVLVGRGADVFVGRGTEVFVGCPEGTGTGVLVGMPGSTGAGVFVGWPGSSLPGVLVGGRMITSISGGQPMPKRWQLNNTSSSDKSEGSEGGPVGFRSSLRGTLTEVPGPIS
jgi:hypothetical protein